MLSIEKYLEKVFEIIRLQAKLEEVKRIQPCVPHNTYLVDRIDVLHNQIDKSVEKISKEIKPLGIAPYEQYIDIELHPLVK